MKSILRTLLSAAPRKTGAGATSAARRIQQALELGQSLRAVAPAAAASASAAAGTFQEHAHTAAGLSRRYKLYVPTRVAAAPMLVVMLHGCTQDADDFAAGTRMNALAEREGFFVLYPIQARTANPAGCWNWFRDQDQRRDQGEAAFLADLTATIVRQHHVDPGAVFAAGLSAGAAMAAILAREYPEQFAAVALHSGLAAGSAHNMPDAMRVMQSGHPAASVMPAAAAVPIPAIVFQGDLDHTVHPLNADHLVASLLPAVRRAPRVSNTGHDTSRPVTRAVHGIDGSAVVVEQWTLHGAGHAWSGGDSAGTYTDPEGPDASAEMVRFFTKHRRAAMPLQG